MATPDTLSSWQDQSQSRTKTKTNSTQQPGRSSIAETLAQLHHDKKNQSLRRLNAETHSISRRPIQHAPIASPFAGAGVEKVVYVSSKTPIMAAVKRVRRFMRQIARREGQAARLVAGGERDGLRRLAETRDTTGGEEVVVRASGRAMAKAVAVGRWFEDRETEWRVSVQVRGGSVSTVDDVVTIEHQASEDDDDEDDDEIYNKGHPEDGSRDDGLDGEATTPLEGGDTTMELLGAAQEQQKAAAAATAAAGILDTEASADAGTTKTRAPEQSEGLASTGPVSDSVALPEPAHDEQKTKKKRRKRTRKRRAFYDPDDVPEQRLRWIKTVEVAISFKP